MRRRTGTIQLRSLLLALGVTLCMAGCGTVTSNAGLSSSPAGASSTGTVTRATGSPTNASVAAKGTLAGRVMARSSCGAQNPVSSCPLTPVHNAALSIETASGAVVVTVTSDQQGRFSVSLSPGHYRVQPVMRSGAAKVRGAGVAVDIVSGRTVSVQIVVTSALHKS